jgi:hypothetical protein
MARGAVPRTLEVQMSGVRIGDLYAITFPLEVYSQIGLDVRRLTHPRVVMIAAYTNGLIGYAMTDRAKDQGGYGPDKSHRFFPQLLTAIGRGSETLLARTAADLLRSLEDRA